ncbi:MAG: hypothetical protein ACRCZF_15235, partial [Gemmataceae bacterium]
MIQRTIADRSVRQLAPLARFLAVAIVLALSVGCVGLTGYRSPDPTAGVIPAPGTVPNELSKISLPPYVCEPPDLLAIEVVNLIEVNELDEEGKPVKPEVKIVRGVSLPVQPLSGQF